MGIICNNIGGGFSNLRLGRTPVIVGGPGNTIGIKYARTFDNQEDVVYFGEVSASELFTGDELAGLVGMTTGVSMFSNTTWFKVLFRGKILYIPKTQIRHTVSWDDIYNLGLVYGTNNNGVAPSSTPTNQRVIINKGVHQFIVRLLNGSSEPHDGTSGEHPIHASVSNGSEWNELMYRFSINNPLGTGDNFESYTDSELGLISINGRYSWCKEQNTLGSNRRIIRGNVSVGTISNAIGSGSSSATGWRPVLELI
jgi:hypothetical protein